MLLINSRPPNTMGMIQEFSVKSVPIPIGILAGALSMHGKYFKIIDEQISPIDKDLSNFDEYVKAAQPPYIFGLSCLTINISRAYEIARNIKTKYPESTVIFGGIHPSILPEEALEKDYIDIVVRGEGEETVVKLYDKLKNNEDFRDIKGISFKDKDRIIHNPNAPLIKDLDSYPLFPYHLFDRDKYYLNFIATSRGCPYECIFCSQRAISGRKYRFRSAELIIREIEELINNYNTPTISFLDDDFLVNRARVEEICKMIVRKKLKAKFGLQTRGDRIIRNKDLLGVLKAAGFTFVGLGMETGSERLMELIGKKETVRDNIDACLAIKEEGLGVNASFIFGLPTETKADRYKAYIIAKKLKLDYAKFNNVVPYPGTKLYEVAQGGEGEMNVAEGYKNFNSVGGFVEGIFSKNSLPYIPKNTKEIDLRKDIIRANLYFNFSLQSVRNILSPPKGNPGWFILPAKWYLKPKELFSLAKLFFTVVVNFILTLNLEWFWWELKSVVSGNQLPMLEEPPDHAADVAD